jgi:hypothetical protein
MSKARKRQLAFKRALSLTALAATTLLAASCPANSLLQSVQNNVTAAQNGGGIVAAPQISPKNGSYYSSPQITITCPTPGSTIHYTTDGSTPTKSTSQYSGPIAVTMLGDNVIKAIGTRSGMNDSSMAQATITILLLQTPTGLSVSGTTTSSVSLSWNTSTGATSYWVCRGVPPSGVDYYNGGSISSVDYYDTGLVPNTTYTYFVSAANFGTTWSALSTSVLGTTLSGGGNTAATPSGLQATGTTSSSVSLSWNVSTGAAYYQLYRDSALAYFGSATGYTDSFGSYAGASTHSYTISASNSSGSASAMSPTVSASISGTGVSEPLPTGGQPTPPAPTLTVVATTASSVLLSWPSSSDFATYLLYRNDAQVSSPSYTDTGLLSGSTHSYTVYASNSFGNSAPAAVVTVTLP